MKQIVFVDDDPHVLAGLRRMLASQRQEWDMRFANSASEALQMLDERPADVVVTDMRMPRMDGAALLEQVREKMPRAARIVLSGHADENAALRSIGVAQQFLAKPCDAEVIKSTIRRTCALREALDDAALLELVGALGELPTLPESYRQLSAELAEPEPDIRKVSEIISRDVAMTAKMLQLVNSAFFGLPRRTVKVHDAVVALGLRTLRALVLHTASFSAIADGADTEAVRNIAEHSVLAGNVAARLLRGEGCSQHQADEALHAGLLQDIGEVVIAVRLPDKHREVQRLGRDEGLSAIDAELRVVGASHAAIGGYLLGAWGMSDNIVSAVLFHHTPVLADVRGFNTVLALHVAHHLLAEIGGAPAHRGVFDLALLKRLGLEERLDDWRETVAHYLTTCREQSR
jgi:HD-like signal output (HDOD) protein